jgi:hypothetical protein
MLVAINEDQIDQMIVIKLISKLYFVFASVEVSCCERLPTVLL